MMHCVQIAAAAVLVAIYTLAHMDWTPTLQVWLKRPLPAPAFRHSRPACNVLAPGTGLLSIHACPASCLNEAVCDPLVDI